MQNSNVTEVIALKALFDYAANERDHAFCTSWTSYAMTTTSEEDLIVAALEEQHSDVEHPEFEKYVPNMLLSACVKFEATDKQIENVAQFIKEMMTDLIMCNMREEGVDIVEEPDHTTSKA